MNSDKARKMTEEERESAWRERISSFEHSGMSLGKWCVENHVSRQSFCHWRKRLSGDMQGQIQDGENQIVDISKFLVDPVPDAEDTPSLRPALTIRSGEYCIDVYEHSTPSILRNVLEVLHSV